MLSLFLWFPYHGSCVIRSLPCRVENGDVSELSRERELLPHTNGGIPLLSRVWSSGAAGFLKCLVLHWVMSLDWFIAFRQAVALKAPCLTRALKWEPLHHQQRLLGGSRSLVEDHAKFLLVFTVSQLPKNLDAVQFIRGGMHIATHIVPLWVLNNLHRLNGD